MTRNMWFSSGNSRSWLLPLRVIFPMRPLLALPSPTAAVVEVFLKFDSNPPPSLEDEGLVVLTLPSPELWVARSADLLRFVDFIMSRNFGS